MGYFDGLVDACFKTTNDGTLLFYPTGVLGKGYILPNVAIKQKIRSRLKFFLVIMLGSIIILNQILQLLVIINWLSWPWVGIIYLSLCGMSTLLSYLLPHIWVKELQPSEQKLTFAESYQNSARSHNIVILWVMEIISILLLLFSVFGLLNWVNLSQYSFYSLDRHINILIIILFLVGIPFWGLCAYVGAYMIKSKTKK